MYELASWEIVLKELRYKNEKGYVMKGIGKGGRKGSLDEEREGRRKKRDFSSVAYDIAGISLYFRCPDLFLFPLRGSYW